MLRTRPSGNASWHTCRLTCARTTAPPTWTRERAAPAATGIRWSLVSARWTPASRAAIITFLESYFPYRGEWTPEISDIGNDLTFMVFIQIVLPKLLSFLFSHSAYFDFSDDPINAGDKTITIADQDVSWLNETWDVSAYDSND